MKVKNVSIRFPEEMKDKLAYIAGYEGRSLNSHVLYIVRRNIAQFEKKYGEITDEMLPETNLKIPKKS